MTNPESRDGFDLSETRRTLPMALLRLRELVMAEFRPILSEHGVTEQQWRVLRVLKEVDEITASDLADRALILAPSLSRILKGLDARGLIAMDRSPGDARRARIRLAEAGRQIIAAVSPRSAGAYARIEATIGADRFEALLSLLDEANCALEAEQAGKS